MRLEFAAQSFQESCFVIPPAQIVAWLLSSGVARVSLPVGTFYLFSGKPLQRKRSRSFRVDSVARAGRDCGQFARADARLRSTPPGSRFTTKTSADALLQRRRTRGRFK
ncbi:hypothetical protein EYF80_053907 [Liparis tanakae]|uniref:Uncharacterized protein n=1 Tax=Liparis tanakae TaxID=230148 RepID=A0A4Z2F3W5_9TELE|nr:hypothetical protein EYF80_053907 [Liparis tanakae]